MRSQLRTIIPCLCFPQCLTSYIEPRSSPCWIFKVPTIWCGSGWMTNGRPPWTHPQDTSSILWCPLALQTLQHVFQNLLNNVLRNMLNKFVFLYVKNILIFSRNEQGFMQHVCEVLQNKLYVKAEKFDLLFGIHPFSEISWNGFCQGKACHWLVMEGPAMLLGICKLLYQHFI